MNADLQDLIDRARAVQITYEPEDQNEAAALIDLMADALEVQVARITELEALWMYSGGQLGSTADLIAERDEARAQIAAALAVHAPKRNYTSGSTDPKHVPSYEMQCNGCGAAYPCSTVRALSSPVTHPEPEPDWEFGIEVAGQTHAVSDEAHRAIRQRDAVWPATGTILRRVKAGPWEQYDAEPLDLASLPAAEVRRLAREEDESPVVVPEFVDPEPIEAAVDLIARYIIWQQVDPEKVEWEDWPEIGEFDFERIVKRVEELAPPCPDLRERKEAVEYLIGRANLDPAAEYEADQNR